MSFETSYPGSANLIGNVDIPRNVHPTIRASFRRLNPDLISSAPYYASAAGKTLRLNYTKEVATVVTPATVDITLTGNSLAGVISDINAADSSNIQAIDLDGFLTLKNLNPGKTHFLTVSSFSTPSDDAAPILGFEVSPFPGSTSFAGEISSAPGSRSQLNPQTTTLLARDSSLETGEINRGFSSILQMLENLRAELSRDVVVYKDVFLSFSSHNPGPVPAARINDDSLRLFLPFPEADPPSAINPKDLVPFYRALDSAGLGEDVVNFGVGSTDANALLVTNLYYATNLTNFTTNVFTTWGTPDGGTIISSVTPNKTKHPSTNITSIKGNIVTCSSATFVTHKVKAGDPIKLTATTLQPFDHSGWFAVDAVIDETHLAIRSMAVTEEIPDGTTIRPRWLNPLAGGTLLVAVGRFIPAGDIYVTINSQSLTGNHVIRVAVGVPFIQTLSTDRARDLSGGLSRLGSILNDHLQNTSDRHAATNITGFTSATTWRDGTTITGANLKQTIEDVLTDLKAQATGDSGTGRIGAEVISIGGGTPNTLAQGTVLSQLTNLLTALQTHVNLSSGAHAATSISYAGGGNWADGTTNPSTTVEGQLDKVISDLSGTGGTAKIGGNSVGGDLSANPLSTQLSDLVTNWLKLDRNNTISGVQTFTKNTAIGGNLAVGGLSLTFSNITFTADSVTDKLTATAHGLQTGDGPLRVSNSGGALPGNLVAGVDYWAIFVDANNIKLAASLDCALQNFEIDLVSNGTGTQTLSAGTSPTRVSDVSTTRSLTVRGGSSLHDVSVGGEIFTYPLTTFTANATFDEISIENHLFRTGDGPVQVSNSGGALPSPLLSSTDYWVIRLNNSKFKLATTLAKALAGNAIDLTTNGTGTNSIQSGTNAAHTNDVTIKGNLIINGNPTVNGTLFNSFGYTYPGSAGIEQAPDITKVSRNGAILSFLATRSGSNGIVYPLSLPAGLTINRMTFAYDRLGNQLAFSILARSLDVSGVSSTITLINDTTSSGFQSVSSTNLATNSSGFPTGGSGSLLVRSDRVYWILAECVFTSGSSNIHGIAVNL